MSVQHSDNVEMTVGRIEAFSDGVFAVAVTLLALNLQIPHLQSSDPASALVDQLLSQWPSYLSYIIAFLTLGAVWITHHQMLRYFARIDSTLQTLNILFLMFITITPFTTGLLAQYIQQPNKLPIALSMFGGGWALNGLCFKLLWIYAKGNHFLKPTVSPPMIRQMGFNTSFGTTFGVIAAILAFFLPVISLIIYAVIVFGYTGVPLLRVFRRPNPNHQMSRP